MCPVIKRFPIWKTSFDVKNCPPVSPAHVLFAFPRPSGTPSNWLRRFTGPGGLVPQKLQEMVDELPCDAQDELRPAKNSL